MTPSERTTRNRIKIVYKGIKSFYKITKIFLKKLSETVLHTSHVTGNDKLGHTREFKKELTSVFKVYLVPYNYTPSKFIHPEPCTLKYKNETLS